MHSLVLCSILYQPIKKDDEGSKTSKAAQQTCCSAYWVGMYKCMCAFCSPGEGRDLGDFERLLHLSLWQLTAGSPTCAQAEQKTGFAYVIYCTYLYSLFCIIIFLPCLNPWVWPLVHLKVYSEWRYIFNLKSLKIKLWALLPSVNSFRFGQNPMWLQVFIPLDASSNVRYNPNYMNPTELVLLPLWEPSLLFNHWS